VGVEVQFAVVQEVSWASALEQQVDLIERGEELVLVEQGEQEIGLVELMCSTQVDALVEGMEH